MKRAWKEEDEEGMERGGRRGGDGKRKTENKRGKKTGENNRLDRCVSRKDSMTSTFRRYEGENTH